MSTYLPDKLNFTEYKPSMQGIPTQSVARLYDRLDKQAYAADAQSSKMKIALAAQLATANPADQPYLQNMYNSMEGLIDTAKDEKNLPGYANQIRNMVSDMASDQTFAGIQANGKKKAEYEKNRTRMEMQYGAENIIDSGDNPTNFSTINPDTGELQQFMGQVSKRPDYTTAMMKLFKPTSGVLDSPETLNEFIYGQGEEGQNNGFKALAAYADTPEGRIHLNDLSNTMYETPYIRLDTPARVEVQKELNKKLENAGMLKMKGGGGEVSPNAWGGDMWKKEANEMILSSGIAGTSYTDGDWDGEDQTLQIFEDQVKDSAWDNTLLGLVKHDREHIAVDVGGHYPANGIQIGSGVDPTRIQKVNMTSALSPTGNAIAMVTLNALPKGWNGNKDTAAIPSQVAYIELPQEDIPHLQGLNSLGFMNQLNQSSQIVKQGSLPLISNIYAPDLGPFAMNKKMEKIDLHGVLDGGLTIKREGEWFVPYDGAGNPIQNKDNKAYRFGNVSELRAFVGRQVMQRMFPR